MRKARPIPTLTTEQIERFYNSLVEVEETGCWEWQKGKNNHGYGVFYTHKNTWYAHRISYALAKGQPSITNHLDHLCRNTSCVNPDHLEDVTPAVNVLRGFGVCANHARKTHCPRGHELEGKNLIAAMQKRKKAAGRACRACDVAARKARHRKLTGDFREAFIQREADSRFALYMPNKVDESRVRKIAA